MDITDKNLKCEVCGTSSIGFSMIYDIQTKTRISQWGRFCSYGCAVQYNILDKSLSQCSTPNKK